MRVVNLKKDNQNADYALFLIDEEIRYSKATGNRVILIIHGYGSHGQGGVIKNEVKKYLPKLKKANVIEDYVFGENWGNLNPTKSLIESIEPETILNQNLSQINSGVSVILI